jgi:hypothetical protein
VSRIKNLYLESLWIKVKQLIIFKDGQKIKYDYKIVSESTIGNNIQLLTEPIIKGKRNLDKTIIKVSIRIILEGMEIVVFHLVAVII